MSNERCNTCDADSLGCGECIYETDNAKLLKLGDQHQSLVALAEKIISAAGAVTCIHNEYGATSAECTWCESLKTAIANWRANLKELTHGV